MKIQKNTHMYNACTFALCAPIKLVFFTRNIADNLPKLPDVPDRLEYKKATKSVNEKIQKSFKSINKLKEYKELKKLDPKKADALIAKFKADTLGNDSLVSRQLKINRYSYDNTKIPLKAILASLKLIPQSFEKQKAIFLKQLEAKSAKIKKIRNAALKTFFTKTLPNDIVKDMVDDYSKDTGISQEAMKQAMNYGSKLAMVGTDKLIKKLVYVLGAFKKYTGSPYKMIVDEMNAKVKPHVDKVDIAVENFIEHEMERINVMPEEGKKTLLTYARVGATVKENKETRTANENFVKNNIEKKINAGEKVTINISGNTSAEGGVKYNKELGKRRARAKKAAMIRALTKVMGDKWKGKVEFKITTQQVEPKLKMLDLPRGFKKKYESTDPKYAEMKLIYGTDTKLKDVIKKINSQNDPASKLSGMIALFAGKKNIRAVLREYNTYMRIKINSKHEDAERWLQAKSKFLKNNDDLLIFLHKNVGRARSAEVKVLTPKKEEPKVAKGTGKKPEEIKAASKLSKRAETLYYDMKEYSAAIEVYKDAFAKNPDYKYLSKIGSCYLSLKKKGKAMKYFNKAVAQAEKQGADFNSYEMAVLDSQFLKKDVYRRYFKQGIKKFDLGNYNEAIALFKKADEYQKTAKIHTRIALCYKWLGNKAKALKHYKLFLKLAKKEKGFGDKARNRALVEQVKKTMIPQLEA
ncbi:tetratricopeptide repeat protein [Patescibacteria group bacterium]